MPIPRDPSDVNLAISDEVPENVMAFAVASVLTYPHAAVPDKSRH